VSTLSLTLQPRYKLIYRQCTCMGLGNASCLFAWAFKRARYLLNSLKWPSRTQAGSLPTCPMDPGQAKAQADNATYMPMAMPLALRPRHQLIHSQGT
jgi:hypothetical protein